MVDNHSLRRAHDLTMHHDGFAAVVSGGVDSAAVTALGKRFVLAEPFIVGGVNDGEPALGQFDIADVVVGQLGWLAGCIASRA